jgi:prepilin-type N-terminal cleavage/methylation domain-containing protein
MKNKKGLTLIEVIISIAIIGILAVSTLSIFDAGLLNIIRAGKRTETVLEVKDGIDLLIITKDDTIESIGGPSLNIDETPIEIIVDFSDSSGITDVVIEGKLSESKKIDDKKNIVYLETVLID